VNTLEFIQKLTEALAWPITVMIAVFVFRKPIVEMIGRVKKVKVAGLEAEVEASDFKETLSANSKKLQSIPAPKPESQEATRFDQLLKISSKTVIVESWKKLEKAISQVLIDLKIELTEEDFKHPIKMLDKFFQLGTSKIDTDVLRNMYLLRNKVVHYEPLRVSAKDAKDYYENTQKILTILKQLDASLFW